MPEPRHTILIERQVVRADGRRGPAEIVAVYDDDPEKMADLMRSRGGALTQRDGRVTRVADDLRAISPSERFLDTMTREHMEGGRP